MSKPKQTDEDVTSTGNVPTTPLPLGSIVPLKPVFPKNKKDDDDEDK